MELLRQVSTVLPEKPWHRLAIKLHLLGWTMLDISTELRQPIEDVTAIITSPKGKEEIAKAIEEDDSAVRRILEAAGVDSIYRLIALRDGAQSETVRYNAAKTLLEQGHGKPLTKVEKVLKKEDLDPDEEAEQLKTELGFVKNG